MMVRIACTCALLLAILPTGCGQRTKTRANMSEVTGNSSLRQHPVAPLTELDPCVLAVTPLPASGRPEIIRLQEQIRRGTDSAPLLERLGWMFVSEARTSFDPGFYILAQQCASCLESKYPGSPEAMLLRGHVWHNLHRFKDAERLARELVARRGFPVDHGLLGDVQVDLGNLNSAVVSYQKMLDLKPDLHAYARAAHVRWLKGDLPGALTAMRMAAQAASPPDAESAAWVHSRLAAYHFQAGALNEAQQICDLALDFQKDYPPALLLRGRMLLSNGDGADAIEPLQLAARLNPLPEYQWLLIEALRETGRDEQARAVESELERRGAATDPRTVALYLATRSQSLEHAVHLAEQESAERRDIFTLDALAWTLACAGKPEAARRTMELSLAEGTQDARLFFHATVIAAKTGRSAEAKQWFDKANKLMHLLLPSEQALLVSTATDLERSATADAVKSIGSTVLLDAEN